MKTGIQVSARSPAGFGHIDGTKWGIQVESFARAEAILQETCPELPFTRMLPPIYDKMAQEWGLPRGDSEAMAFVGSIPSWPAFADSVEALAYLRDHYRLVAVTNADNWALDEMSRTLGDPFHDRVTAEDVGISKPDPQVFAYARGRLSVAGVRKSDILHVAQSQYHDIAVAKRLGLATAWIYRRHDQEGYGATPAPQGSSEPDFVFTSMADLAEDHRTALAS